MMLLAHNVHRFEDVKATLRGTDHHAGYLGVPRNLPDLFLTPMLKQQLGGDIGLELGLILRLLMYAEMFLLLGIPLQC